MKKSTTPPFVYPKCSSCSVKRHGDKSHTILSLQSNLLLMLMIVIPFLASLARAVASLARAVFSPLFYQSSLFVLTDGWMVDGGWMDGGRARGSQKKMIFGNFLKTIP